MSRCYERLQDDERDVREVTEDRVLRWTPDDEVVHQGEAHDEPIGGPRLVLVRLQDDAGRAGCVLRCVFRGSLASVWVGTR